MKGIKLCGECGYYSLSKHKCTRGCRRETRAQDKFYDDCPLPDVAEVKRGWWIDFHSDTTWKLLYYECSRCGHHEPTRKAYCADCGAKMDGGEEKND